MRSLPVSQPFFFYYVGTHTIAWCLTVWMTSFLCEHLPFHFICTVLCTLHTHTVINTSTSLFSIFYYLHYLCALDVSLFYISCIFFFMRCFCLRAVLWNQYFLYFESYGKQLKVNWKVERILITLLLCKSVKGYSGINLF